MTRIKLGALLLAASLLVTTMCVAETLTPKLCKQKVEAAVTLLAAEGDAAIPKIKDPNGEFRFAGGEGYIWIHDLDGVMLMHPIKDSLDGKNVLETKDENGRYLFAAMNEVVEEHEAGWVHYFWPKPGEKAASPKVSFVKLVKHGGKNYVAGAGMYDVSEEEIKKQFPGDAIYSD